MIRKLKDGDRLNIVLIGKTGAGKSSVGNMLSGPNKFAASNDLSSVTNEVQYVDFEYKGRKFRLIDTPGFFDTKMSPEEIQHALNQFSDIARDGIAAVVVTAKKERFTPENESVCKFVQCVLGDDALEKYGMMLLTHSKQSPESLINEFQRLPEGNHGRRMMEAVSMRVLSVETSGWWRSGRASILDQILALVKQNGNTVVDCLMMEWSRIEDQKKIEYEKQIAPLREEYENEIKNKEALNEQTLAKLEKQETQMKSMMEAHERELRQLAINRNVEWGGRVRHWTENVKDFGRGVRDTGVGLAAGLAGAAGAVSACSIM
jgi:GTP-binding protein EngB required for normal cell division